MARSFSVIIVTWNGLKHLQTFLPSVTDTQYETFEIIIADNASTDRSVEWVRESYPQCNVVTYPRNYGYCGGNNRAVEYASGEILVFLNNDVEVTSSWLSSIEPMFDDPNVAAVQPKIRSYSNRGSFEYAGAAGGYLDKMGYPFCRGRVFETVETDNGQYDDRADLFWASGAALAVRKDLFIQYGRFDEEFRFHMEEIDLCWRFLNAGYRIKFCPESVVYHLGGGSLPMGSSRKTFYNFRNSLFTLWKNASDQWLKKRFFGRLCLDGVAAVYAFFKGDFGDAWAIFRAHIHFYVRWVSIHRHRIELKSLTNHKADPPVMLDTSIVYDYFIRKKRTYREITGE